MAIRDDILTLKNKEGTLTGNKVCNFAYDDTAFEDDTTVGANGVSVYNYNNHNNIPVKDPTVLKVNPTIISKGFRSQVSTLSRMLLNHIFGRVSYNLNKTVDTLNSLLTNLYTYIGQPNGLATLDNTGRLPYSQLPLSAVEYKGAWNANTNTPTLASGTGTFGDEYIVSTQGTRNLGEGNITYKVGDRVIYNGSIWQRIPASSVRTVNSKTPDANGNVTVNASDMVTPDVYGYDRTNIGKAWTQGTVEGASSSYTFKKVYYANDIWVAGGASGDMYWSIDGKTWTKSATSVSGSVTNIYYSDGIWVVSVSFTTMDNTSVLWWSSDGKTWTLGSGIDYTYQILGIYNANGIWVAGGRDTSSASAHAICLWWSNDGKNWTRTLTDINLKVSIYSVYYANGIWVAGGILSGMYWSVDGKNWTRGTGSTSASIRSVYYANGIWVAGGSDGDLWWSNDGKAWTQGTVDGASSSYIFEKVYYANGIWVAGVSNISSSTDGLYWSTDGKTWTRSLMSTPSFHTDDIQDVYYANGIWVASCGYGTCWSVDGKNWTRSTGSSAFTTNKSFCVFYANGIWVSGAYTNVFFSEGSLTNNVATILDWLLFAVDNLLD